MNSKAKVVLSLKELSVPDKVQQARSYLTAIRGNARLKEPKDLLDQIEVRADALELAYSDAQTARNVSVTKTAVMSQSGDQLDDLLKALALHVESESRGDEAVIKSAGMNVKKTPTPAGIPHLPQALAATEGIHAGSIALKWKTVKGSRSYLVRATTTVGDADSWKQVAVCTKSNTTVTGLASGQQYWFQVAAVGSAGQAPWSDPATKIVP